MCWNEGCREPLSRRTLLAGVVTTAASVTEAAAQQPTIPPPTRVLDDPAIQHGKVRFLHNGAESIDGYLARPKAAGTYPAVLVVAGNKISEEYIPNTCAALAVAGFVGLAPNIFHPLPESARTNEEYDRYLSKHTESDRLDDVQLGLSYLRGQPFVRPGGMGIVGFCMGGRMALLFATRSREIDAVVAFHPAPTEKSELSRLTVPVVVHHGTDDHSVAAESSQKLLGNLRAQKTPVDLFLYEGADHGFLAYTRKFYRPEDAKLAWKRTTDFLQRHLK